MTQLELQGLAGKNASRVLSIAGAAQKNAALEAIASALEARRTEILCANQEDMTAAKAAGMRPSLQDRLALDEGRIAGMSAAKSLGYDVDMDKFEECRLRLKRLRGGPTGEKIRSGLVSVTVDKWGE